MLYINKTTGDLVHLLEWVDSNEALVSCLQTNKPKTIPYKEFKSSYILVNVEATRKHIAGCYNDSKIKK